MFIHRPHLINGFLRTGLFVFQQIFNGAVTLSVPCLFVSCILSIHIIAIMLDLVKFLNLLKAEVFCIRIFSKCHRFDAGITVPINILLSHFRIDVFAVFHIKTPVVMLWIIGSVFSGSAIVVSVSILFPPIFAKFPRRGAAAKPLNLQILRQVLPNTNCRKATILLGQGVSPLTRWGWLPSTRQWAFPLDPNRALHPCTQHKGIASLCTPARKN